MQVSNQTIDRQNYVRYLRTITDTPSGTEFDKTKRKFEFLKEVLIDGMFSGMLNCGPNGFDKLSMAHDGVAWVIKLETEIEKHG
jgi:hypothetical protein